MLKSYHKIVETAYIVRHKQMVGFPYGAMPYVFMKPGFFMYLRTMVRYSHIMGLSCYNWPIEREIENIKNERLH